MIDHMAHLEQSLKDIVDLAAARAGGKPSGTWRESSQNRLSLSATCTRAVPTGMRTSAGSYFQPTRLSRTTFVSIVGLPSVAQPTFVTTAKRINSP